MTSDLIRQEYLSADVEDSLSQVIGKIKNESDSAVLVFNGKKLAGVFIPQLLNTSKIDIAQAKVKNYISHVPVIEDEDNKRILELMYNSNSVLLPVKHKHRIAGVVHAFDILRSMTENQMVRPLLRGAEEYLTPEDRLGKAIEIMNEAYEIPVFEENIVGFLTSFDLLKNYYIHHHERDHGARPNIETKAFHSESEDILALPVKNFIRDKELNKIDPKSSLKKAVELMQEKNVLQLASDNSYLTIRDIMANVLQLDKEAPRDVEFVGMNQLDEIEQSEINRISAFHYDKISYYVNNPRIRLHLKVYKNWGKNKKYSVKINMHSVDANLAVDKAYDWDLKRAVHKGFEDLLNSIRNKVRK